MTVKEVLALAAEHLQRPDLLKELEEYDGKRTLSGELASLLRCYNLTENELALDYIPVRAEEEFAVEDHLIPWSRFSHAPAGVRAVLRAGREIAFEPRKEGLFLPTAGSGRVCVRYCYSPEPKEPGDEGEFGGPVSARLLSFGVAREFCLSRGMFEEAKLWDSRYRAAVRAADLPRRALSVRPRRWV